VPVQGGIMGTFMISCLRNLKSYLEDKGVRYDYLHTSGHAKLEDLKKLVDAMAFEIVIPIHSFHPEKFRLTIQNSLIITH